MKKISGYITNVIRGGASGLGVVLGTLLSAGICGNVYGADPEGTEQATGEETRTTEVEGVNQVTDDESSISITELSELVVESEHLFIDNHKVVGIPTRKEKNLSMDMNGLLCNMQMPVIRIENGVPTSLNGESLNYFINGKPAQESDMSLFWPQDVIRVEYMEDSPDPAYMGRFPAVNFVVKVYEAGGVARGSAYQCIPNNGYYNGAAKLEYKAMTYQAVVGGGYGRVRSGKQSTQTVYRDIEYNGVHYDQIIYDAWLSGMDFKQTNVEGAFDAIYQPNSGLRIYHTVGITSERQPDREVSNRLEIKPQIFPGEESTLTQNSATLSPYVKGDYQWQPRMNTFFSMDWSYSYTKTDYDSKNEIEGLAPILNAFKEHNHMLTASLSFVRNFTDKIQLTVTPETSYMWLLSEYSGTYEGPVRQTRGTTSLTGRLGWKPSSKFTLQLHGGAMAAYWGVGEESFTEWTPEVNMAMRWTTSSKNFLSGSLNYFYTPAKSGSTSDAMMRGSELMWLRGTPSLKGSSSYSLHFADALILNKNIYCSFSVSGGIDRNDQARKYDVVEGYDGVVRSYVNAGNLYYMGSDIQASVAFLNNRLNLYPGVEYRRYESHGIFANSLSNVRLRFSGKFQFSNSQISVNYSMPQRYLSEGGQTKNYVGHQLGVSYTWGIENWYFNASCRHLLGKYSRSEKIFDTPNYSQYIIDRPLALALQLQLVYTFGYGKRVDRYIDAKVENTAISGSVK